MQISRRLTAVASLVSPGQVLADIGTDHGYIPIYLIRQGVVSKALAMDVRKGPLSRAQEHIAAYDLEEKIETRLSDGLEALGKEEADRIVIAGMGGGLVVHILEAGSDRIGKDTELVIQPQSELAMVRNWLEENQFQILDEEMVLEDGKYYPMMKIRKTEKYTKKLTELEKRFGPFLLDRKHPVLKQYLEQEHQKLESILDQLSRQESENAIMRIPELKKDHLYIMAALEEFGF